MEALIWDTSSIAFSLGSVENHLGTIDYTAASEIARRVAVTSLQQRFSPGMLLNINIPYLPAEQIKGIRITRQGLRVYRDRLDKRIDPRGRPYYWIGGDSPTGTPEAGTDVGALSTGYVSITPIQLDLTMYTAIPTLGDWGWENQ
jgi:5'-nucleotidase